MYFELDFKKIGYIIAIICGLYALSLVSYIYPAVQLPLGIVMGVVFFVLSVKSLSLGALIIMCELLIGVQGYLFSLPFDGIAISLRIMFFVIWLSLFVQLLWRQRVAFFAFCKQHSRFVLFIPLLVLLLGVVRAVFFTHIESSAIFFDANAWLFWLYAVPFMYIFKHKKLLWNAVVAAALWWAVFSLFVMYVFGHQFETLSWWLYHWLRDYRLFELTPVTPLLYRFFSQSMVFMIIPIFVLGARLAHGTVSQRAWWRTLGVGVVIMAGYIATLSRSFWLGASVAAILGLLYILVLVFSKRTTIQWGKFIVAICIIFLGGSMLWWWSAHVPLPRVDADAMLFARFGLDEPAALSRIRQLGPLSATILQAPVWGSGFGTSVTYLSTDPRIVAGSPGGTGWYTTTAFEWGYLDMLTEVGIVGTAGVLLVILMIGWRGLRSFFQQYQLEQLALLASFLALLVTHMTTPYLNHPLGIGFLLIIMLLGSWYGHDNNQQIRAR